MTGFYDDIKASSGMYKFYNNGEWKESTSGKGVSILNPTSNEAVYQVQGKEHAVRCTDRRFVFYQTRLTCLAPQLASARV